MSKKKRVSDHKQLASGLAGIPGADIFASGGRTLARDSRLATTNPDRLRIMWYSNSPWSGTGYGQQTSQAITRLAKEGHEVAVHCMYGLAGSKSVWNGFTMYPQGLATYSDDVVVAHTMDWANGNLSIPHLLVTLFDTWVFKSKSFDQLKNIASWVPIDHSPAPTLVLNWCARENVLPIAMSKFGARMLDSAGIDNLYVPHGIEAVFKPTEMIALTGGESISGRKFMEIDDDKFVVSCVATNKGNTPSRKCWSENILAFGIFLQSHPDAVLYIYSEPDGAMGGIDIPACLVACGVPKESYRIVDQYAYRLGLPQQVLAAIYTASDVLLAVSMGEGFGIPVIEAQACGTRVIVSNFSAQPELVGDGWLVEGQPWWDAAQNSWFFTPNVSGIVDALNLSYAAERGVSVRAVAHAEQYGADRVFDEFWRPAMKRLSEWCRS